MVFCLETTPRQRSAGCGWSACRKGEPTVDLMRDCRESGLLVLRDCHGVQTKTLFSEISRVSECRLPLIGSRPARLQPTCLPSPPLSLHCSAWLAGMGLEGQKSASAVCSGDLTFKIEFKRFTQGYACRSPSEEPSTLQLGGRHVALGLHAIDGAPHDAVRVFVLQLRRETFLANIVLTRRGRQMPSAQY